MSKTPIDSFAFGDVIVHVDTVFDDDHPYVKAYPSNFKDYHVDSIAAPPKRAAKVEQASAAPGETRDVAPPAKTRKFGTVTDTAK